MFIDCSVDISTDESLKRDGLKLIKTIMPQWSTSDISSKFYSEGITNKLMGFWQESFQHQLLLRIFGEGTELYIDRKAEITNMKLLHQHGLGPKIHAVFNNGFCYDFICGTPLTTETVVEKEIYEKVITYMARFHKLEVDDKEPRLFIYFRKFLNLLPEKFFIEHELRLKEEDINKQYLVEEMENIEKICCSLGSPIVFCHNDNLLNNIIWNEKTRTIHFIDFEYAFPNFQYFDIGNHFCEFAGTENVDYNLYPNADFMRRWLRFYLSSFHNVPQEKLTDEEVEKVRKCVNKFALASHLFWGIWGLVQSHTSNIDFDFLSYGLIRLGEYKAKKEQFLAGV